MEAVPVLVSYHTIYWVRVAVGSYLEHFPGDRILVVDNNPKRGESGWGPACERERRWLASHPSIILLATPAPAPSSWRRSHGAGLDLALEWCRRNGKPVLLVME